jgi:hypothetical protein
VLDLVTQNHDRMHAAIALAGIHFRLPALAGTGQYEKKEVELLTAQQIASDLGIDRGNLSRLMKREGITPVYYYNGKVPLYPPSTLHDLLALTPLTGRKPAWEPPPFQQP